MEKPLISVIVPIYKTEAYLERCISTLVHQTYKNLEIILVDDGSPDRCPRICDAWAERDSRIRVIHTENRGISHARNCGLHIATGRYIAFADSDDWLSLVMLERLEAAMERYSADIVICQFVNAYADGTCEKPVQEEFPTEVLSSNEALKLLLQDYRITNHVWRKLYKRELIPPDIFPEGKYFEDIYITYQLFLNCETIVYLNEPYYFYRETPGGVVCSKTVASVCDYLDSLQVRHRNLVKVRPELQKVSKEAMNHMILAGWQGMRGSRKDSLEQKKLQNTYWEKMPELDFGSPLQLLSSEYKRIKISYIIGKHFPRLEGFLYDFALADASPFNQFIQKIKLLPHTREDRNKLHRRRASGEKFFWIFCTPGYGNLGDRAIYFSEEAFIRRYFPDYQIRKVYLEQADMLSSKALANLVGPADYCAVHGGGNIGTLYPFIHEVQEKVIHALRKKRLFMFPQTFCYSADAQGKEMLQRTKQVYASCENLCLFVREEISYAFVQAHFPVVKSVLMPDMVLGMPAYKSAQARHGALVGIRTDSERTLTSGDYEQVLSLLENRFHQVEDFDTHLYRNGLSDDEVREELTKLWERMSGSELVVTDRLHGIIFAAITQTPGVLLLSKSPKIEGVYQWLKQLPYIRLAHNGQELEVALSQVLSVEQPAYFLQGVEGKFEEMAHIIQKM